MGRVPFTGGPLNWLNGRAGTSAPHRSVPVIQLIRVHRPRSAFELEALITSHWETVCPCGIVSQGRVQDFGRALFEAQRLHWGEYRYSLQECTQWMYDLFVHQAMRGDRMESEAAARLSAALAPVAHVQMSDVFLDCELRIDLEVLRAGQRVAGVQVKPISFFRMRSSLVTAQAMRHAELGLPVFVLCYDAEGHFVALPEIARAIRGVT